MASLEVTNLSKRFGNLQALDGVELSVKNGEFLVLLGPTAAGKTTTLKCLTGLIKPDSGLVKMDGADVAGLSPAERDVALVFQTYALYPRKTVFENMAFPLRARDMDGAATKTRVSEIASKLQIDTLLNRKPAQLSGGQQQRVALGRAMVRDPRVFFMDEPLTNLDFALRVEMRAELKRQQKELGKTFFYVTNDQVEAMSVADRIAVLNKGVLQQVDTPEVIYERPANLFVARFVGSPRMNTLPCHAVGGELVGEGWRFRPSVPLPDRQGLTFGIRPEDISLFLEPQTEAVVGEVQTVEPLGDRSFVDVAVAGLSLKMRVAASFEAAPGDRAWLRFDPERFHLFDKASAQRVEVV